MRMNNDEAIKSIVDILERIMVKLDHIDHNMFPDPEHATFNLMTKKDYARIEEDFTQEIQDQFRVLKENLK